MPSGVRLPLTVVAEAGRAGGGVLVEAVGDVVAVDDRRAGLELSAQSPKS